MTGIIDVSSSANRWSWNFDEHIPSDTGEGRRVLQELLMQLERHEWGEHDTFGIHLAVEEALVNAIHHGNQDDLEKRVHVVFRVSPTQVRIEISDEGSGFDPTSVPDPTEEENLEIPCGRGLMLMRNFMSLIEFNEVGNAVTMEKSRSE